MPAPARHASDGARAAPSIQVNRLSVEFRGQRGPVAALRDLTLGIGSGEFVALVGRSGSGKSTLLRTIGGLLSASGGVVRIGQSVVDGPPAQVRFVAQDYAQSLLPWLTVRENVHFGERHAVRDGQAERHGVEELIELVGLSHAIERYPRELSGGMQQRVAIARAIASRPGIMLLDEAFGSVDALSRAMLQDLMLDLWHRFRFTAILVTHDMDEAIYMADRVIVLNESGHGIAADVPIDLPRPRQQIETREEALYLRDRRELLKHVLVGQRAETVEAA